MDIRKFVNGRQTKKERKAKYNQVIKKGFPTELARKLRDWTQNHVNLFLENNNPKDYKHYK